MVAWRTWVLAAVILAQGGDGIRITQVQVPQTMQVGGDGELFCAWEEDTDKMYSIKWYQGAQEFYRYTPTARDPIQIFDPITLDVDRDKSWGGTVRIANVSLDAEGPFHCEVSADGPTFHTASDSAMLTVVDLPDGAPVISGVRSQYLPGDWVDLTCTSGKSKPATILNFTVNTKPAPLGWLETQIDKEDDDKLFTSRLRLRFSLLPRLLQEEAGSLRVRCEAEIPGVYSEYAQDILTTRPPYQASVLGSSAPDGPCSCRCSLFLLLLLLLLLLLPWPSTPPPQPPLL
ncbi:uncharacterized protein LOC123519467 isoform X2 [Portunus trituberculatus]|uniref:uncharacterized protein LOC123519467 isoform X2 n=1 Tax=Portunus trituberculatus TaxID=210409 RepID=UPI001E1D0D17|nr:uncharacterized protein LOC123519467 isoform X2 [Portunus trituberculatus]